MSRQATPLDKLLSLPVSTVSSMAVPLVVNTLVEVSISQQASIRVAHTQEEPATLEELLTTPQQQQEVKDGRLNQP